MLVSNQGTCFDFFLDSNPKTFYFYLILQLKKKQSRLKSPLGNFQKN